MAGKKTTHRVEVNYVKIDLLPNAQLPLKSFEDILTSDDIKSYTYIGEEKDHSIHIIRNDNEIIIGYVKTIQHSNLPPKINNEGIAKPILEKDEKGGIGYSNIFLYDKLKKVLYYEVNVHGCTSKMMISIIDIIYRNEDSTSNYAIIVSPVFDANEYERIMKMTRYSKIIIEILAPAKVLQRYNDANNPIKGALEDAKLAGAERVRIENRLDPYSKNSLNNGRVEKIVTFLKNKLLKDKVVSHNVNAVVINGITDDGKSKSDSINLLGDILESKINVVTKRSHTDLQIPEKRSEIFKVYNILDIKIEKLE